MATTFSRLKSGFTLLELLIVLVLVSLLATIAFPLFGYFREKARDVSCIANLRVLWVGANGYMLDHEMVWPQMLEDPNMSSSESPLWKWWFDTLYPYGVAKHHWICASESASYEEMYSNESDHHGSYIPTDFDATPNVAFMWGTQPWFIERGEFHGRNHGANIVVPDGTVRQAPAMMQQ